MNIAAIIAEYNPFHTGHGYHVQKTREISGADAVICIMSGSFVQRGQPACLDKFTRTRLALMGGADMVLELPAVYSLQSAEYFAMGAVRLLKACNMVNSLSFGVEKQNEGAHAPDGKLLRQRLDNGEPYCKALGSEQSPNSLLGTEYMRAIEKLDAGFESIQILRDGAGHDSMEQSHNLSASRLRLMMAQDQDVSNYTNAHSSHFLAPEAMFLPLLCKLRSMEREELEQISQVGEGLEYVIKEAAKSARSLDELILMCKSKRYTYSRLARIMCCAFLGITKEMTDCANREFPYIRVLGVKKDKTELLGKLTAGAHLPVCINTADFINTAPVNAAQMLKKECVFTDLRASLNLTRAATDFTNGLIIL